jgi:glycosyltransferase involved in cell wall biosynthesis
MVGNAVKKVCIVKSSSYYPQNFQVKRNAETLVANGYKVDVITQRSKGQAKRETINGVDVYRLPVKHYRGSIFSYCFEYSYFFILASLQLARLSLKKGYDIVEVDTIPDFVVFATILPRLQGTRVILNMFENVPELFTSSFKKGQNHVVTRVLRLIERTAANYSHHIICANGPSHKRVLESYGIAGEKITVILNSPDEVRFNIESPVSIDSGENFRLMVVSGIIKRYGIQTLIKAVPLLIKDIPELKVDIVGQGEYLPVLKELARDLGVEAYINFTGYIPDDDMVSYMARADITVAPMIDDVGHPIKIFEYFALGKCTVASTHPSLLDTFDKDCLLYFQPGNERDLADRILELYYSPEKRAALASSAWAFYQGCRWQVMQREYLKIYEGLLNHGLSRVPEQHFSNYQENME